MSRKEKANNQAEILIVEDSPTQAEQLKYILEEEGHHISVAYNGKEALSSINKHKPTIVVSDIVMPEMDGYQLCRHIKTEEKLDEIPVILLTALSDPKDVVRGLECGADNFIVKPYDEKYLLSRIQYILTNLELRKKEKTQLGVQLFFGGRKYFITSERQQILDLLLSTYETAVQKNNELIKAQDELRTLNDKLEEKVGERTVALEAEIIERKRVEENLRKSERGLNEAQRIAQLGNWEWDIEKNEVYWSEGIPPIFGLVPKESDVSYETFLNSVHPEDREFVKKSVNDALYEKKPYTIEHRIMQPDGSVRIVHEEGKVRYSETGKPIRMFGTVQDITERKQAEQALRESEDRYRDLVENSQDLICTHDLQGNFLSVNPAAAKLLGYDRSTILSMNVRDILAPEVRDEFPSYLDTIRKQGHAKGLMLIQTATGEKRILEYNNTLRTEGVASPIVRAINHDITERERAEQALRESEERYRILVETSPDAITLFDLNLNIIMVNQTTLSLFGYGRQEEVIGKSVLNYLVPEQLARAREDIGRLLETGSIGTVEYTLLKKDGTRFPAELRASLITDREKKPSAILCVIRNITERKQAEEALRNREQEIRVIAENVPALFSYVGTDGRYCFVNKRYEEWFGVPQTEVIGKHFREILGGATYEIIKGHVERVLTGHRVHYEEVLPYSYGGTRYVSGDYVPDRDDSGKVKGFFVLVTDITERKRAEEEMAALQEQLRQSQKMEAIGQLAGGVAHDFNNLLTIIKGYSQLSLTELREEDPLKENLKEVGKAADQAARLTRQILAFSRRQMMEMKVLDLNTILRDLDKMLRRVIGEDVELVTLLAGELGRARTDPGQVEQVIMNLAVNARDAMPHGGKLTIETANVELDEEYARNHIAVKPGDYVMLAVSDTGVGMTPEVRDRVFEPFFTTKEKSKGTGLGLSTVYGIVKQSGGNIWVYSEPNHGTTFKIYLPRVDEPLEELKQEVVRERIHRGGETILLVEDEAEVRKLAARVLEKQGYTVLEARNGEEALFLFQNKKEPIHLILTDVVMPQMGGPQLVEQLRQVRQDIKVLYMSGYTDNSITHQGVLEKGMNYIQKPFTIDGLTRKVREVLDM
jgi:two-component system cell cycle sensor histidine kinase/response regulator CckA